MAPYEVIDHHHPSPSLLQHQQQHHQPLSLQCMHRTATTDGMRIALPTHMCIHICTYVYVCICCLYTAGHRTRRGRVTSLHVPHSVVYMRRQTSAGATAWPAAWSKHSSKLDAKHPRERPSEQVPQSAYRLTPTVCVYEPSLCAVYVCE